MYTYVIFSHKFSTFTCTEQRVSLSEILVAWDGPTEMQSVISGLSTFLRQARDICDVIQ